MDKANREFIQDIIDNGKDLTLATIRPDGYPQATTVSYANDGLTIYVGIGKDSQKANNIRHCEKVSLTINAEYKDWNHIKGLSMGATAQLLEDQNEIRRATECMVKRYPQVTEWAQPGENMDIVMLKITPKVISVLDYEKGFGHTELVSM
ncbi:MAG TPA: pyridoxamine 5'-phosphate oxidase family protein [Noviherbaspirillum sp.]|uniref:pyridoxamine 5'-phosphate oxidase family protein n=1 Tax=Noviherbaspirillum sp. TaxID=1926288 RepID=UPI002B47CF77|nr:pyridoxamine 5'-phosphate oxidase family protein [Noviherbaspirillum sp.]HJV86257.1 pyridoxamine 5'-phosphate oxidase family protein [Noviherbaspirillum sp.]